MSAIQMTCTHCGGQFLAGMVGMTPWPKHVCPDGTEDAPAELGWPKLPSMYAPGVKEKQSEP